MRAGQRVISRLAVADVILFVLAAVFNDHSSTSVDGILWWVAIAGFVLLFVVMSGGLLRFLWVRARARFR